MRYARIHYYYRYSLNHSYRATRVNVLMRGYVKNNVHKKSTELKKNRRQ